MKLKLRVGIFTMPLIKLISHRVLGFIILVLLLTSFAFAAAGDVDSTFSPILQKAGTAGTFLALQPDGKMYFHSDSNFLYRLNQDGTLDTTFNCPSCNFYVYSVGIQADGKILLT